MEEEKVQKLTDLISLRTLQRIQDSFSRATGLSAVIVNADGSSITRPFRNRFCSRFIHRKFEYKTACRKETLKEGSKAAKDNKVHIYICHAGLANFVFPIKIDGEVIAFVAGGEARLKNPDMKECQDRARKIGSDLDDYLEAYLELPLLSEKKVKAAADLLSTITHILSSVAILAKSEKQKVREVSNFKTLLEKRLKRNESLVFESENKYSFLLSNIQTGIVVFDKDDNIVECNPKFANIMEYSQKQLSTMNILQLVTSEEKTRIKKNLPKMQKIKYGQAYLRYMEGKSKSGKIFWVEAMVSKVKENLFLSIIRIVKEKPGIKRITTPVIE